jgi:PhzF family phenazine biosynthesis protein
MSPEVLRYAAFTAAGRGGNPAGVVLDASSLTDRQMLAIAQAIGYSETAFVVSGPRSDDGDVTPTNLSADIRFFSPLAEVAFCGHATIATAVVVAERLGTGHLALTTAAGPVAVETHTEDGDHVATLTSPSASAAAVDESLLDEALEALRWDRGDLDPRYPAHVAQAGNRHLLVGVRHRSTLARLAYDYPSLAALMAREGWTTAHLFWAEDQTTFHARDPFPPGGVVEDPATGAAAAAFGGYLRDLGLLPHHRSPVRIHQGHDMGSPSLLLVDPDTGSASVRVSGRATPLPTSPYDGPAARSAHAPTTTTTRRTS